MAHKLALKREVAGKHMLVWRETKIAANVGTLEGDGALKVDRLHIESAL